LKKHAIPLVILFFVALTLCGSASADSVSETTISSQSDMNTTDLPSNRHIFINVSNYEGAKYNNDSVYYAGPNGTYYILAEGGGLNQLHITNSTANAYGQVNVINATSTSSSGVFYITTTGGRGYNDDIILLLSVKGPISDDFSVTIISSGYNWTLTGAAPTTDAINYVNGAVNETFTKSDFQYGPHVYKPGPGTLGVWSLPLYYGQNTSDPSTAEYLMFIDLYVGNIRTAAIDNGAVKVEYTFNNLNTKASFNSYAWTVGGKDGEGISWTNKVILGDAQSSGYTVNYSPVTPVADFSANTTSGNAPLNVQFTDTSSNYPTSWIWDFGDGSSTSTEQNPTHTYTKPGNYTVTLTAINAAGNSTQTLNITAIDVIPPTVTANPVGGLFNTTQTITLTTNEPATIYYTTDGTTPTTTSTQYTAPINIETTTILKFMAIDAAGNQGPVQTETYTIDTTAPTVQANPVGGNYNNTQTITLTPNETATIYYTTDGTTPTTTSNQYTTPININTTTTLKFMAIDAAGNQGPVQTETYNIKSDVYVQITPSITNPTVGDKVTYTFKLGNNGPGDAHNIVFTYVIPEGVEYAGANVDQGTVNYDPTTRTLTWTVGNVAAGVDPYLWLNLNIQSAGTFNIQPTVTVAGYNPGLINNIGSLLINATITPTNTENTNTVNAATTTSIQTGTVPMQTTGAPLAGLILGILCIGSGITLSRKK